MALLLAGCGAPDAASGDGPPVDSTLVAALADLHLADARAALAPDSAQAESGSDSLRALALAAHGLDAGGLRARLDALAADPALARATYDAVEAALSDERQGLAL